MRASEFLTEDRNSFVADQLGDKLLQAYEQDHGQLPERTTPLDVVNVLALTSPKLVQWLATRYVGDEFKFEDLPAIKQALTRFAQVRARLPDEHKDLNKLSLGDLYRALAPFENKEVVSNKQAARDKKQKFMDDGDAELIYKDSTIVVLSPKTEEASVYFGIGTKWCTAATKFTNYFNDYNKKGILYIIMTKHDGKFQIHFEKREFKDAVNEQLEPFQIKLLLMKYPKLYDVFDEIASEKLYLPLIKNPSEKVQRAAVHNDGFAIENITNPSERVQMTAMKHTGHAIQYVNRPSEAVKLAAVQQSPMALRHIPDPSEEIQLVAVRSAGFSIGYIENPSEKVQLAAVQRTPMAVHSIKNPSEEVKQMARNYYENK